MISLKESLLIESTDKNYNKFYFNKEVVDDIKKYGDSKFKKMVKAVEKEIEPIIGKQLTEDELDDLTSNKIGSKIFGDKYPDSESNEYFFTYFSEKSNRKIELVVSFDRNNVFDSIDLQVFDEEND